MKGKEGGGKAWEDKRDEGRAMELEPRSCCEYLEQAGLAPLETRRFGWPVFQTQSF